MLVGVDDSAVSHAALDHAAIEAELRGWGLRLVHVQPAGTVRGRPATAAPGCSNA